jgi:hypothetical protein
MMLARSDDGALSRVWVLTELPELNSWSIE